MMRLTRRHFFFDTSQPERLTQGRWIVVDRVSVAYLAYKWLVAVYWLVSIALDLYQNSFMLKEQAAKYMLYATRWGALLITFSLVYDCILVTVRYNSQHGVKQQHAFTWRNHWLIKMSWFLCTTAFTVAFFVTVVYWAFLFDYNKTIEKFTIGIFISFNEHLVQTLTAILDTMISSRPCRLGHIWCPMLFVAVYATFNAIYVLLFNGTDPNGYEYIYHILNWKHSPWKALGFAGAAVIILPLLHGLQVALAAVRDKIWCKLYHDRLPLKASDGGDISLQSIPAISHYI